MAGVRLAAQNPASLRWNIYYAQGSRRRSTRANKDANKVAVVAATDDGGLNGAANFTLDLALISERQAPTSQPDVGGFTEPHLLRQITCDSARRRGLKAAGM